MSEPIKVDAYILSCKEGKGSLFMVAGAALPNTFVPFATLVRRDVPLEIGRIGLPIDLPLVERNLKENGCFIDGPHSLQLAVSAKERVR